jgi:DNA replication and repair protein RecF
MRRAQGGELARRSQGVGWRISAGVEGDTPHEIVTGAENAGPRTVQIDGKATPQNALGRLVRVVWLTPVMDRLWLEGASERRRFLDRISLSFAPDHADAASSYERAMRERNRLLKDGVREPAWFDALERQMADAGAALSRNRAYSLRRLTEAQDDAISAFPRAALALSDPDGVPEEAWSSDALRQALGEGRSRDQAAGRSLTGPHRSDLSAVYTDKGMEARACSTGEQKALLISLILASARAVADDTGAPPLILLDEVAAHLDADRRAALYDEICALGAQAWMTGTGPELFEDLGARAQQFRVIEEEDGSRVLEG